MRRFAVVVFLLLSVKFANAQCFMDGSDYNFYRSTIITGAWTNSLVATGPVCIAEIQVTSAAAGSSFQFFNSTWANGKQSTSAVYDTSSSLNVYRPMIPMTIGPINTNGFMFTTIGNSTITVKWDWMDGAPIPNGQQGNGRY